MKTLTLLASFILFASCNSNVTGPSGSNDDELSDVVFRDLFVHNYSIFALSSGKADTSLKAYYIGFYSAFDTLDHPIGNPRDPADDFMLRLSNMTPPVKKMSEAIRNISWGVKDKITGETGLIIYVGPIIQRSETSAELNGGWYFNGGDCGVIRYVLHKEEGRWWVFSAQPRWTA